MFFDHVHFYLDIFLALANAKSNENNTKKELILSNLE